MSSSGSFVLIALHCKQSDFDSFMFCIVIIVIALYSFKRYDQGIPSFPASEPRTSRELANKLLKPHCVLHYTLGTSFS